MDRDSWVEGERHGNKAGRNDSAVRLKRGRKRSLPRGSAWVFRGRADAATSRMAVEWATLDCGREVRIVGGDEAAGGTIRGWRRRWNAII